MLLGMTVTLFSAIFVFVNKFPTPPAQGTGQFQTSLVISGSNLVGIKIVHGTGPAVPSTGKIFLRLTGAATSDVQFSSLGNQPIGACLNISTTPSVYTAASWIAGETWFTTFSLTASSTPTGCVTTPAGIAIPAGGLTVTVLVIVGGTLLYNIAIATTSANQPPVIVQVWTYPSIVPKGTTFWINATILNLAGTTGTAIALTGAVYHMNATVPLTFVGSSSAPHLWSAKILGAYAGNKTGSYTAFLQATNTTTSQTASANFIIQVQ